MLCQVSVYAIVLWATWLPFMGAAWPRQCLCTLTLLSQACCVKSYERLVAIKIKVDNCLEPNSCQLSFSQQLPFRKLLCNRPHVSCLFCWSGEWSGFVSPLSPISLFPSCMCACISFVFIASYLPTPTLLFTKVQCIVWIGYFNICLFRRSLNRTKENAFCFCLQLYFAFFLSLFICF